MVDGERLEPVVPPLERLARLQLDDRQRVREPAEERLQIAEELARAARAVHGHARLLAAAEGERLQHPRQAEDVVGVQVREEDLLDLGQSDRRALELALRPLRTVEQQPHAATAQEQCGRRTPGGRHRRGRAEEDEVEIHRLSLSSRRSGAPIPR